MPNYHLGYQTKNTYKNHVGEAVFALLVLPSNDTYQQLVDFKISNSLQEPYFLQLNLFGFDQLMIRSNKPFDKFELTIDCDVIVKEINPFDSANLLLNEENEILRTIDFKIDHQLFLTTTQSTTIRDQDFTTELQKSNDTDCATFLKSLNEYIFNGFTFEASVNSLTRNTSETIAEKRGVCQDFTNLFIGICRANGIPARFVSGYLNQGEGFKGSAQMHAWVEAYIPGVGWQGYDPTNNLLRDSNYVKVCHGVDYQDCAPIRGVLQTSGENYTNYKVKVEQQ